MGDPRLARAQAEVLAASEHLASWLKALSEQEHPGPYLCFLLQELEENLGEEALEAIQGLLAWRFERGGW